MIIDRVSQAPHLSSKERQDFLDHYARLNLTIDHDRAISYCLQYHLPLHLTLFSAHDFFTVGAGMVAVNDHRLFNAHLWRPLTDAASRAKRFALTVLQPFLPQTMVETTLEYIYPYLMIYGTVEKIQEIANIRLWLREVGLRHRLQPTMKRFAKGSNKDLTLRYSDIIHLIFEYGEFMLSYHHPLPEELFE